MDEFDLADEDDAMADFARFCAVPGPEDEPPEAGPSEAEKPDSGTWISRSKETGMFRTSRHCLDSRKGVVSISPRRRRGEPWGALSFLVYCLLSRNQIAWR